MKYNVAFIVLFAFIDIHAVKIKQNLPNDVNKKLLNIFKCRYNRHRSIKSLCTDVDTFLKSGAQINARDENGNTPLHLSIFNCFNRDIIAYLIEQEANVNARNLEGDAPLHLVAQSTSMESSEIGEHVKYLLDIAQLLVKKRANVNAKNNDSKVPIHCAVRFNHQNIDILLFFLTSGADVRLLSQGGNTILHNTSTCKHCFKEILPTIFCRSQYNSIKTAKKINQSRTRLMCWLSAIGDKLPIDCKEKILLYLPQHIYSAFLTCKALVHADKNQLQNLISHCPFDWLKQNFDHLQKHHQVRAEELKEAIIAYRIEEGKKLITRKNAQGITTQKMRNCRPNDDESKLLDPEQFEHNYAAQIREVVSLDLEIHKSPTQLVQEREKIVD